MEGQVRGVIEDKGEEGQFDLKLFSSGNAKDFDFDSIMGEIENIGKGEEESNELEEMRRKAKEDINKNRELEMEDLENDDDLVTAGMDMKYDLLEREGGGEVNIADIEKEICGEEPEKEKDDDEFFNQFVEDILGEEERPTSIGNLANIRLGRRRRNRTSEEALETKEVNEFLDEIARMENTKSEEKKGGKKDKLKNASGLKRDIYIQQRDQYFVDDEEVYLNELETDHCDWTNIRNLFKVVTHAENESITKEDESRETVLNYFHDICKGLMNSRSEDFLSFVYSNSDVMDGLIKFAEHEGVQKVLDSVLNLYDSINNLNSFRFLKHRFGLYRKVLKSIVQTENEAQSDQLTRVFVHLVKEKNAIIDANYFIDKILLDNENHVAILDKVLRESNVLLTELASLVVKRVVPEEEKGFLEENSVREINKNFGKRLIEDKLEIEFAIDENVTEEAKFEEGEDKKLSNQTTAEVSMNVIFDVYDPMTLKKNNFTKTMIPRVAHLKCALFGESHKKVFRKGRQAKGLKSISEFNESQKEEEEEVRREEQKGSKSKFAEVQTFVVNNSKEEEGKKFVINLQDLEKDEEENEEPLPEIQVNMAKEESVERDRKVSNPFVDNHCTPPSQPLNLSGNSIGSANLYEMINMETRFRTSYKSTSSGYSKDNLVLNLTPDKPKTSSIDAVNFSDKKNFLSDCKAQKTNLGNLEYSVNSRPSFLDRKPPRPRPSKMEDNPWDELSVNTADLINSEAISVMSDNEKQTVLEEILDLDLEHQQKMLLAELLRQKTPKEANMMVNVLRKMPWVFTETLEKKKHELIRRKKERKERRLWEEGEASSGVPRKGSR